MDPFVLSFLTYITIFIGTWAGAIALLQCRIMLQAKVKNGTCRTSDKTSLIAAALLSIGAYVLIFVWPGLIYMIPATVAFVEIASIPVLGYLSEIAIIHWRRMKAMLKSEVDEHAAI